MFRFYGILQTKIRLHFLSIFSHKLYSSWDLGKIEIWDAQGTGHVSLKKIFLSYFYKLIQGGGDPGSGVSFELTVSLSADIIVLRGGYFKGTRHIVRMSVTSEIIF